MKKALSLLLAITTLLLCASILSACNSDGGELNSNNNGETSHSHDWKEKTVVEPTCSTPGSITYTCECGEEKTEESSTTGHTMTNGVCSVCGKSSSTGLKYELSYDKSYYTVVGIGSCTDKDLIIPNTYEGLPVKYISNNAFNNCDFLVTATLPDSVKLGISVFVNCDNIKAINVDKNNSNYRSIDGVLYIIQADCIELEQYPCAKANEVFELPSNATKINDGAFLSSRNLKEIKLHDKLTQIGAIAFYGCASLEQISIPDQVQSIGAKCFNGCASLKSIKIGRYNKFEGEFELNGCISFEKFEVDSGNELYTAIDGNLYSKDRSVLLRYCSAKTEKAFEIPSETVVISDYAFMSNDYLETITIGKNVSKINYYAFAYCDSLSCISYLGTKAEWNSIEIGKNIGGYSRQPADKISCTDGDIILKK